jgi:hypothetical protein
MKFKIGSKVTVRKDLRPEVLYGNNVFTLEMSKFRGKHLTVEDMDETGYYLAEDDFGWTFTEEMLLEGWV